MESKHKFPTFRSNLIAKTEKRNNFLLFSSEDEWPEIILEAGNGCNENFVVFPWAADFIENLK